MHSILLTRLRKITDYSGQWRSYLEKEQLYIVLPLTINCLQSAEAGGNNTALYVWHELCARRK